MSTTNKPRILFMVGMPGAGKSTCVNHLTEKEIPSVYFGGVVVEETKRRNNGKTNEKLEKIVREELRAKDGNEAIAKQIIIQIDELLNDHRRVVADGLYSWTEYKLIKKHYGEKALVVAITAPRHIRHERLASRPIRPLSKKDAISREYAEIENLEKGGPIANADYTVDNSTNPLDMINNLDKILTDSGYYN